MSRKPPRRHQGRYRCEAVYLRSPRMAQIVDQTEVSEWTVPPVSVEPSEPEGETAEPNLPVLAKTADRNVVPL